MIDVTAGITLAQTPEIGLSDRIRSGIRPSFNYSGMLVACEIVAADESEWLDIGKRVTVRIRLYYADDLDWDLRPGSSIRLNAGGGKQAREW